MKLHVMLTSSLVHFITYLPTMSSTSTLFSRFTPQSFTKIPIKPQFNPSLVSLNQPKNTIKWASLRGPKPIKSSAGNGSSAGLYSAQELELNSQNVDTVLEEVRPYLIADGGNVDVVSVEDGVVSLKLQGACGTCPSSTTTMKMGIERVLKEKFGNTVKDIRQVYDEEASETTVEAINNHLDILRPAIKNFGGSVDVLSVAGGDCLVKYEGPESIGSGVKAAIKEKFPDIVNVVFSS